MYANSSNYFNILGNVSFRILNRALSIVYISVLGSACTFVTGENRTFYSSVGIMQTPNFPDRYPHRMNVRLEIPEYTDAIINLTIDVKDTENCYDTVLVDIFHPRALTPKHKSALFAFSPGGSEA